MAAISQMTFSHSFLWMKMFKFHWSLLPGVQLTISSIGWDNGLAPNRRQAIIWTNDVLGCRRIYAFLGLNELKENLIFLWFHSWLPFVPYFVHTTTAHESCHAQSCVLITLFDWNQNEIFPRNMKCDGIIVSDTSPWCGICVSTRSRDSQQSVSHSASYRVIDLFMG